MTADRTTTIPNLQRPTAPLGGFNLTLLKLEVTRLLRNKRTLIFTIVLPVVFYLIFGGLQSYGNDKIGNGNVSAYIAISMALYGAALATTAGGSSVSIEVAQGWSRQLRLTPLSPLAYVFVKAISAMMLGLASVIAVYVIALVTGKAQMPVSAWILSALTVWVGSLLFAMFGLFAGYLLPTENVMQILSFALVIFAFAGGLFVPITDGTTGATLSELTPMSGVRLLGQYWLHGQAFSIWWVVNIVVWLAIFAGGAAMTFRRATRRM